tara:strand:- start:1156 stop:1575 length:420 start_codon:yes stop_codon:yes gene_type:complete
MIRKFEQEAIVNQIMEGISEKADSQIEKAKKSADYKAIVKMTDKLKKLKEQRDALSRTLNKEELEVNQAIHDYNVMSQHGVYCLRGLETYNTDYDLNWIKKEWEVKRQVSDKLAIALLEPNAQTRVKDIIMAIVNEVAK